MSIPELTPKDSASDKLANVRKAIGAGVSAAFAAAVPLLGLALTDGVVTGEEAGNVAAAFAGGLISVAYVTWQTVNRPKPSDVAKLQDMVAAVPPIVLQAADPSTVQYVGSPELPVDPADLDKASEEVDATPPAEGYTPKHTA